MKWLELKIYREDLECLDDTERKNLQKNVSGYVDKENIDNCVEKITNNKQIGLIEIKTENESENADILPGNNKKLSGCTRRMLTLLILSLVFLIFILILFQASFLLVKKDEDRAANISTYTVYDLENILAYSVWSRKYIGDLFS